MTLKRSAPPAQCSSSAALLEARGRSSSEALLEAEGRSSTRRSSLNLVQTDKNYYTTDKKYYMFRRINPHASKKAGNYKDLLDITMAHTLQSKYKGNGNTSGVGERELRSLEERPESLQDLRIGPKVFGT